MTPFCIVRVPDNCDFVRCGGAVVRLDLCQEHLDERVVSLQSEIHEYEKKIAKLKKIISQLRAE
jgi:hypothetical protein